MFHLRALCNCNCNYYINISTAVLLIADIPNNKNVSTKISRIMWCGCSGACHYLTNRFQMEAPVAPSSRSLRGACLREGFAEPPRRLHEPFAEVYEPFAEVAHTEGSTKTPWMVHEASSKGPWMNCMFLLDHDCDHRVWSILYCF